jgi:hypothetical protein
MQMPLQLQNPTVLMMMMMMYHLLPSSIKNNWKTRRPRRRQSQRVQRQWVLSLKQCVFL